MAKVLLQPVFESESDYDVAPYTRNVKNPGSSGYLSLCSIAASKSYLQIPTRAKGISAPAPKAESIWSPAFVDISNQHFASTVALSRFLTITSLAIAFTLVAIVIPLRKSSLPEVVSAAVSAFGKVKMAGPSSAGAPSRFEKLRVERQTHYVLEIIKDSKQLRLSEAEAKNLASSIVTVSNRAKYDPLFVAAVIKSESTFNSTALSPVGAKGLMQIMPNTGMHISKMNNFEWNGAHRLEEVEYNLELGIAYLKELDKKFRGNKELVLIAYNWGPANVFLAVKGEKEFPTSSKVYAQKILKHHKSWSKELSARAAVQGVEFEATA